MKFWRKVVTESGEDEMREDVKNNKMKREIHMNDHQEHHYLSLLYYTV